MGPHEAASPRGEPPGKLVAMQADSEKSMPRVIRVRDLAADAEAVIRDLNRSGEPVFLTQHGRFVAVITPVGAGRIESQALAELAPSYVEDAAAQGNEAEPFSTAQARGEVQTRAQVL